MRSCAERVALLEESYLFAALPGPDLERIAQAAQVRCYPPGEILFREGDPADAVHVVSLGQAEETVRDEGSQVPVALVGLADVIGEEALRSTERAYGSTVTAIEETVTLAVPIALLSEALSTRGFAAALESDAEQLDRIRLIRRATSFATLPTAMLRDLAAGLVRRDLGPGEVLLREGEAGDHCYLVGSGTLAVHRKDAPDGPVAMLGPGELIGEVSLLAGEPRRATLVAVEPVRLLELDRGDLLRALDACGQLAGKLRSRAQLRVRPRRRDDVEIHVRHTAEGETILVLKDPVRRTYFQLSELGAFVWSQLDGATPIKTIVMRCLTQRGVLAIQPIAEIVANLLAADFARPADGSRLLAPRRSAASAEPGLVAGLRRRLVANLSLDDAERADRIATRLFGWLHPLTTRAGAALLAALGLAGLALALTHLWTLGLPAGLGAIGLLLALGAYPLAIALHETAHALAMKAAGLKVNGFGIGWYWLYPIAYVDTSDTWIAGRRERLRVALAGPVANFAVGGTAALLATASEPGGMATALWIFAGVNLGLTVFTLNPHGDNDGAQALENLIGMPTGQSGPWSMAMQLVSIWRKKDAHRERLLAALGLSLLHTALSAAVIMVLLVAAAARPIVAAFGDWAGPATALLALALAVALSGGISTNNLFGPRSADG